MNRFIASFAKLLLAILIAGGTLATDLHAQSDEITVNVPFAFIVGTHTIAPGTYRFSLMSSEFLLSVVNTKTGDKQIFDVRPELQNTPHARGRLIFRKSADRPTLCEIHFSRTETFSELIESSCLGSTETGRSTTSANAAGVGQP